MGLMPQAILLLFTLLSAAASAQTGNAARGETLFREFRCLQCHPAKFAPPASPEALASAMWNHAAGMSKAIEQARLPRPEMSPQQAADLYAFLGGGRGSARPGDARQGESLYQAKLCASCHDDPISGAPALARRPGGFSAYSMIAGLWMHGGGMLARMVAGSKEWQQLSPAEIRHLAAFLNTRK